MSRYIEKIKKKALQGDANAQHELAFEYYSGTKIEKNNVLAVEWWLKSAKKKFPKAYYNLAYMYFTGSGVEKSFDKAIKYHELSIKKKHTYQAVSLFWLGYNVYLNGTSGKSNVKKGLDYLEKAAKKNLVNAQFLLSNFYARGEANEIKIEIDKSKSLKYLKLAAKNKFIPAVIELCRKYLNGDDVKKDIKKASNYLEQLKDLNNSRMINKMTIPENDKKNLKKSIIDMKKKVVSELKKEINSDIKNKRKNRSDMTYQEAFELITTHSEAFKMFPAKLKKDKRFFLKAMQWAVVGGLDSGFEHAHSSLKKSRNFILKAVKIDGYALNYIDEKFKKDKEIVLEALERDKNAFQYVHESLKNDPDVLKLLKNKYGKTPTDPGFWL